MFYAEIENFLSDEECKHLIRLAQSSGLETSKTFKQDAQKGILLRDLNSDKQLSVEEVRYTSLLSYFNCI